MPNVISINDISIDKVINILNDAYQYKIKKSIKHTNNSLEPYNIGILFFEPSTRTMMSFQSAINRCNGKFIQYFEDSSSEKKGESFHDTIKTFEQYCDLLIIRHPDHNIFKNILKYTSIPLINAGDGSTEHPSQALLDLFTIQEHYNDKDFKSILFVGDLKHSRTINSLIKLLKQIYPELKYYFLSPELLHYDELLENSTVISSYDDCIYNIDVIYMTRIQYERFNTDKSKEYWQNEIKKIEMTPEQMNKMKPTSILMHPLPRNEELSVLCDSNSRSKYFQQMENGVYVRMALLNYCLNDN